MMKTSWDVIIVGGGPAGFFAGIRCAELDPKLNVLIIEKASQTLGKVIISGGGRCNVTHACFEPDQLITCYPRGGNELRGAFSRFQPRDTVEWFESRGVKLKVESDGRMLPVTDSSESIANCLRESARKAGVKVELRTSLLKVEKNQSGGFKLEVRQGAQVTQLHTRKLLIASGSDRKILEVVKSLGYTIIDPIPSLF
jgi:predicted Rossmann fold flavoprotein